MKRYVIEVLHPSLFGGGWNESTLGNPAKGEPPHTLATAKREAKRVKRLLAFVGQPKEVRVKNVWNHNTWEVD